jgi:hypothetical protein
MKLISDKDRNEIYDLMSLYSFTWDSADADGFADLFTRDAECKFYLNGATEPSSELHGKEEMRKAAITRAGYFKKIGLITKHFMPNTVITTVDINTAKTRTQALITWQMIKKDLIPHPVQAGYYDSVVTRTADGWKFQNRAVRLNGRFDVKEVFGE